MPLLRNLVGVAAGMALGVLLVIVGEAASHALWPPPPGLSAGDPQAIRDYLANAPFGALISLPLVWTLAAFAGAFAAAKITGRPLGGWIAGGVLFAATLTNLILVRHPAWVLIVSVAAMPLATFIATRLAAPRSAPRSALVAIAGDGGSAGG